MTVEMDRMVNCSRTGRLDDKVNPLLLDNPIERIHQCLTH
jgi:hypothetical protein